MAEGHGASLTLRPQSERYVYRAARRLNKKKTNVPNQQHFGIQLEHVTGQRQYHPHLYLKDWNVHEIQARQHNPPEITWNGDPVLNHFERQCKFKAYEVDGRGFCPFNSAFVCMWTIGRREFQNGEDLFTKFIDYCYNNEERLISQHVELQSEFDNWIESQIRPHVNTVRETMFLVLAEFLQVNILILSNIPHSCALFRPGDESIYTTIAIYNSDTGEGGHFMPLIPTTQDDSGVSIQLPGSSPPRETRSDDVSSSRGRQRPRDGSSGQTLGMLEEDDTRFGPQDYEFNFSPKKEELSDDETMQENFEFKQETLEDDDTRFGPQDYKYEFSPKREELRMEEEDSGVPVDLTQEECTSDCDCKKELRLSREEEDSGVGTHGNTEYCEQREGSTNTPHQASQTTLQRLQERLQQGPSMAQHAARSPNHSTETTSFAPAVIVGCQSSQSTSSQGAQAESSSEAMCQTQYGGEIYVCPVPGCHSVVSGLYHHMYRMHKDISREERAALYNSVHGGKEPDTSAPEPQEKKVFDCPMPGCNNRFLNLYKHLTNLHPQLSKDEKRQLCRSLGFKHDKKKSKKLIRAEFRHRPVQCPVPGCDSVVLQLYPHLYKYHKEVTSEERAAYIRGLAKKSASTPVPRTTALGAASHVQGQIDKPTTYGAPLPSTSGTSLPSTSRGSLPSTSGTSLPSRSGASLPSSSGASLRSTSGVLLPSTSDLSLPSTSSSSGVSQELPRKNIKSMRASVRDAGYDATITMRELDTKGTTQRQRQKGTHNVMISDATGSSAATVRYRQSVRYDAPPKDTGSAKATIMVKQYKAPEPSSEQYRRQLTQPPPLSLGIQERETSPSAGQGNRGATATSISIQPSNQPSHQPSTSVQPSRQPSASIQTSHQPPRLIQPSNQPPTVQPSHQSPTSRTRTYQGQLSQPRDDSDTDTASETEMYMRENDTAEENDRADENDTVQENDTLEEPPLMIYEDLDIQDQIVEISTSGISEPQSTDQQLVLQSTDQQPVPQSAIQQPEPQSAVQQHDISAIQQQYFSTTRLEKQEENTASTITSRTTRRQAPSFYAPQQFERATFPTEPVSSRPATDGSSRDSAVSSSQRVKQATKPIETSQSQANVPLPELRVVLERCKIPPHLQDSPLRPQSVRYIYARPRQLPPKTIVPNHQHKAESLENVLEQRQYHPHLYLKEWSLNHIAGRQHENPTRTFNDQALATLEEQYKVKAYEVDGEGFCPFNSAFVCLWTIGKREFQNGEDLFTKFIDYCHSNKQRLTKAHAEIHSDNFANWIASQTRPHSGTQRQTLFLILAEFLQVNIIIYSNQRHLCQFYPTGDNSIDTTIMIYTKEGDHFVPLIPTTPDDSEVRLQLPESGYSLRGRRRRGENTSAEESTSRKRQRH